MYMYVYVATRWGQAGAHSGNTMPPRCNNLSVTEVQVSERLVTSRS